MNKVEQYGILIRYEVLSDIILFIIQNSQDDYPFDLALEVREITLSGVQPETLDREGLDNSVGDEFWMTVESGWAEIGAESTQKFRISSVTETTRPHDIDDLRSAYCLMQRALAAYKKSYGTGVRNAAVLRNGIGKFISTRHERLATKAEFFSQRNPLKAARYNGMLTLLEEIQKELGQLGAPSRAQQTFPVGILAPMRRLYRRLVTPEERKASRLRPSLPQGARPFQPHTLFLAVAHATSSESLHEMLAAALNFPGYYGKNWDAFSDCIMDSTQSLVPRRLVIRGLDILREHLPVDAEFLENSLIKAARAKTNFEVVFESADL
jgi:ribonuclease inhibitor